MPPSGRVRSGPFVRIVGTNADTLRSLERRGESPLSHEGEGAHRTFGAGDVLDWLLFDRLRETGMAAATAADAVKLGRTADFHEALRDGRDARGLAFIVYATRNLREDGSPLSTLWAEVAAPERAALILADAAASYGERRTIGYGDRAAVRTAQGVKFLHAIPLWPLWHEAQARAAAAGYRLDGAAIVPVSTDPEAGE